MILPGVPMELVGKILHPILRVYSRKFTQRKRTGSKHRSESLYVGYHHPSPVKLGKS